MPGQEPIPAVDPTSGPTGSPPIEYVPTPPPGYPAYGAPYFDTSATNGMAVASLVCSLVGIPLYFICFGFSLSIIGIVLGMVALNQVNKTQQRGKGMSIAGIVVGGVGLLAMGLFSATYF